MEIRRVIDTQTALFRTHVEVTLFQRKISPTQLNISNLSKIQATQAHRFQSRGAAGDISDDDIDVSKPANESSDDSHALPLLAALGMNHSYSILV